MRDPTRRSVLVGLATLAGCSAPHLDGDPLEALPADDPALAWSRRVRTGVPLILASDGGRAYVGVRAPDYGGWNDPAGRGITGSVLALEADGTLAWRADAGGPVVTGFHAESENLRVVFGLDGRFGPGPRGVAAYDADGTERWATEAVSVGGSVVGVREGRTFLAERTEGDDTVLVALDGEGEERWRYDVAWIHDLTVAGERVYVATGDNRLLALS